MKDIRTELATQIASRICHDLISPIGAISNGLELVAIGGTMIDGPELQLITESCTNANARIRFFRVAYGMPSETARLSALDVRGTLADLTRDTRLRVTWTTDADALRADVQLAFLALQCVESALRRGGDVTITAQDGAVRVEASAEHVTCDPAIWHHLEGRTATAAVLGSGTGLTAAQVQFGLLPLLAADQGRRITVSRADRSVTISV